MDAPQVIQVMLQPPSQSLIPLSATDESDFMLLGECISCELIDDSWEGFIMPADISGQALAGADESKVIIK